MVYIVWLVDKHIMASQVKKGPGHSEDTREKGPDNEIRVRASTFTRTYLAYVARLFQDKHDNVIIRGTGYAIPRAVALAMLVRKRFKGLHQIVEIGTNDFNDRDFTRKVGLITITLSQKPLNKNSIGYSAPLPDSEVTEYQPYVPGATPPGRNEGEAPRRARGGRFEGRGRRDGSRGGYARGYGSGFRTRRGRGRRYY